MKYLKYRNWKGKVLQFLVIVFLQINRHQPALGFLFNDSYYCLVFNVTKLHFFFREYRKWGLHDNQMIHNIYSFPVKVNVHVSYITKKSNWFNFMIGYLYLRKVIDFDQFFNVRNIMLHYFISTLQIQFLISLKVLNR